MGIGKNIRDTRIERGLTQTELALGIMNRVVLVRIEMERAEPSVKQLQLLSRRLRCTCDYLLRSDPLEELDLTDSYPNHVFRQLFDLERYEEILQLYHSSSSAIHRSPSTAFFVGMCFARINDPIQASEFLTHFCGSYEKWGDVEKSAYVLQYALAKNTLAKNLFFAKQPHEARKLLEQSINALEKQSKRNHTLYLSTHQNLINYYLFNKEPKEAIRIGEPFLAPSNKVVHKQITAYMHQSISVAYYDTNDFSNAHRHLDQAVFLYLYSGNEYQAALCNINRFNLFREENNLTAGVPFLLNNRARFDPSDQLYHVFGLQIVLAYVSSEAYEEAIKYMPDVSYIRLRSRDRHTYNFLNGILLFKKGDLEESLRRFESCEEFFLHMHYFYDLNYIELVKKSAGKMSVRYEEGVDYLPESVTKNVFLADPVQI